MLRGIIVRLLVAVAVPTSLLNPFSGILWYLWYSHFRPNDFIWPQWAFKIGALLIAVSTLVGYVALELQKSPPRWRGLGLMTLFWAWIAFTAIFAGDRSLAFWKVSQYTNILVMTLVVAALATTEDRIFTMMTVMGVSVGLLAVRATIEFLLTGAQNKVSGVGGVELEGNEFALALNMGLTILVGLSYMIDAKWARYVFRVLAVFCLAAVVGTFSRSGFLGSAIALLILTWYSKRRMRNIALLALTVVMCLPFVPERAIKRYQSIPTAAELDPSAIARIQTWETGLKMIRAHPILGVGPLNFQSQYSNYLLEKYKDADNYHPRAPHNAYVALAAESGIPSLLFFISFIGATIVTMWRLRRLVNQRPDLKRLGYLCLTIQMSLMVYLVPNFFISRQNEDLMWHLVGIAAGLAGLIRTQLSAGPNLE